MTIGIFDGIAPEQYHADALTPEPALSRSGIVTFINETAAAFAAKNPRLTQWPELLDQDGTDATELGDIVHAMVLGVGARYVVGDPSEHGTVKSGPNKGEPYSTWTGDAGKWKAEQKAAGYIVIDRETNAKALQLADRLTAALIERFGPASWANRRVEQTVIWRRVLNDHCPDAPNCDHHAVCWIWCRARLDALLPDGTIVDVKTTALSVADFELGKEIALKGLDVQREFYRDGLHAATEQTVPDSGGKVLRIARPAFIFAYVQTVPPFTVRFVDLAAEDVQWDLQATRMVIDIAAHRFARCLRTGEWPDHPLDAKPTCPPWFAERRGMMLLEAGLREEV